MKFSIRRFFLIAALFVLAACSLPADVNEPPVAMGNFLLGHNIVVVNEPEILPFSRTASDEDWKDALTAAIDRRFGNYDGEKFYHIGVKIDGYALALPGVPVVFTPVSVLVITVSLWDDAAGKKLNEEEKALTIFEGVSGETLVSSGLTQTKEQQMVTLSDNAAKAIQDWILENPDWLDLPHLPDASGNGDEPIN
ncbi:MAG: hypothetical protein ACU0DI_01690 [Paracoccaceae bacterium]